MSKYKTIELEREIPVIIGFSIDDLNSWELQVEQKRSSEKNKNKKLSIVCFCIIILMFITVWSNSNKTLFALPIVGIMLTFIIYFVNMKKTNSEYRFNISQINKRRALLRNLGRSKSVLIGYKYGDTNMGLVIENKSNQQQFLFTIPNQITIDSQVESIVILLDGTYPYLGEWIPSV